MAGFSFFGMNVNWGGNGGGARAAQSASQTSDINEFVSYEGARDLYLSNAWAQAVVNRPIEIMGHKERIITIKDSPDEVIEAFKKQYELGGIDDVMKQLYRDVPIFGMAALTVVSDHEDFKPNIDLSTKALQNYSWRLKVMDPLAAQAEPITQNPNSEDFQDPIRVRAWGRSYAKSRSIMTLNSKPVYIFYSSSTFNFGGLSVYQGIQADLINLQASVTSCSNIIRYAGALVWSRSDEGGSAINNPAIQVLQLSANEIQQTVSGEVLGVGAGETLNPVSFGDGFDAFEKARSMSIQNICIRSGLTKKMLEEGHFSSAMSEGDQDAEFAKKLVAGLAKKFNKAQRFADFCVQSKAWDPLFFNSLLAKYPKDEELKKGYFYNLNKWRQGFIGSYEDREETSPNDAAETEGKIIDNVIKIGDAMIKSGANSAEVGNWIAAELSERDVIVNDLSSVSESIGVDILPTEGEQPEDRAE